MSPPPAVPWTAHLGAWTLPPDGPAWAAFALGAWLLAAALLPRSSWQDTLLGPPFGPSGRRFVVVTGFVAAFLSLGYVAYYLRGGPRIIDATSYFLQARALAEGKLTFPVPVPTASFRGRFLFTHTGSELAGVFPPGYPLLLALGFLLGAPLVVGPALAFALVFATYHLAREVSSRAFGLSMGHRTVTVTARAAALVSVLSAALRYHTADTMAHGACALAITLALVLAFRADRAERGAIACWAGAGLAVGYVLATRLASAPAIGLVTASLALTARQRKGAFALFALGVLPGAGLLLAAQGLATGDPLHATQLAYYALSDGPPGCFRYGFGSGIGCVLEHGDVVRNDLAGGYGLGAAVLNTLRRLRFHAGDVANAAPLAVLAFLPLGALRERDALGRRPLAIVYSAWGLHVLAYAPFYFQGSYPGGGARLLADVLPLLHVLWAVGLAHLVGSRRSPERLARMALGSLALVALGFAVHRVHEHRKLMTRDGGAPMFEPDVLDAAAVQSGLVFVETDHGFNLGYDPRARVRDGIVVARLRSDDRDRLLWDELGRPLAFVYRFAETGARIEPWSPFLTPSASSTYRFEAEHEWPPFAQKGAWLESRWASDTCASGRKVAALTAAAGEEGEAWIELPLPAPGTWEVTPGVMLTKDSAGGRLELYAFAPTPPWARASNERGEPLAAWDFPAPSPSAAEPTCPSLAPVTLLLDGKRLAVRFIVAARATGGERTAFLDRFSLRRLP